MRNGFLVLIVFFGTLLPGCGIVAFPLRQVALPPAHFREVAVLDAKTRKPILGAKLVYSAHKHAAWAGMPEQLYAGLASDPQPYRKAAFTLEARRVGLGRYAFDQVNRQEWGQYFIPLGLGGALEHTYRSALTVSAPGHVDILVWGKPPLAPTHSHNPHFKASMPLLELNDRLTILLPPVR